MRVVITGAAGRIGAQIAEELSEEHDLRLMDRRPAAGRNSVVADLSRLPMVGRWNRLFRSKSARWTDLFEGAEVVVHLAGEVRVKAPWEKVLPDNIQATWNVFQASVLHRVPRVIFASSNWAVKALEEKMAPACYLPNGPKIGSEASPWPLTAYGASKAFGEIAGRMFVDEGKLDSFVAVRIGYYDSNPPHKERLRTRWIGAQDIRSLLRRCVEAEFHGFHVVYGVSAQTTVPYDLSHTQRLLAWKPRQMLEETTRPGRESVS